VVGLDVSTGNISWQQSIGPLINEKSFPTVDNNGKEMPYFVIIQVIFMLTGFSKFTVPIVFSCSRLS
jgi:hypothetical protein